MICVGEHERADGGVERLTGGLDRGRPTRIEGEQICASVLIRLRCCDVLDAWREVIGSRHRTRVRPRVGPPPPSCDPQCLHDQHPAGLGSTLDSLDKGASRSISVAVDDDRAAVGLGHPAHQPDHGRGDLVGAVVIGWEVQAHGAAASTTPERHQYDTALRNESEEARDDGQELGG